MPLIGAKSVRAPYRGRAHHQFTGGYDLLPTTNRPNRGDNLGSGGSAFHIDALSVSILADIKASIHYMLRARYRKVTICARVQPSSGLKVEGVVPTVISCLTAHSIALM